MKRYPLPTIKAWILICSIIVISSATTEHTSSQHDVSHHGDSMPQKKHQNTIVPFGIQIPGHVLPTQDVACISADSNIFEIMNKAQESCNGTDMRCTFYHFVNHGYQNIGTLDIDKDLFDDLLMKFDNWLLTAENIEKGDVPLGWKTKENSSLDTASINVNGSYSNEGQIENSTNVSDADRLHTHTNESDDDKIENTHHRNHHHKWKNGNHIKLVPEFNNEHRYFEVFLPKDKETGKPRTIYVEVDRDKNEFVLLDEEIDKKLNGIKPIKIELDELSEIADTAFNDVAKSSNKKHHIYSDLSDDERVIISDDTNAAVFDDITNLEDVGESTQNILNPSICNINANQQLIPDNTTGNVTKIVNISKNFVVPNKYINQVQFYVESQIDNMTDAIPNDHLELLENTNETDLHQTGFYEETPLDTIEFNENNTSIDLDLENKECSLESFDIQCENDNDNSTENYEISTEDENVTFDDDSFIELGENNDTSIDIDFDDTHNISSRNKLHLNETSLQDEKPVTPENKLKSTPYISIEPKLTSSLTAGISDYTGSQLDAIPSENRQGPAFLQDYSPVPGIPSSPYTTVPILGNDLAKVLETDGHLQSSFPSYATLDLPSGTSQSTPLKSNLDHPSKTSYYSPLDSDFEHRTTRPKISNIFPSPPVECVVKLNKGSKYSPLNFGFSWLPSYSRIEELRLPCGANSLPRESIMSLPEYQNKQVTESICPEPDYTIPVEDPSLFQTVPSLSVVPSLTNEPYILEADALMPPKPVLPSKLYLPKSNSDLDRTSTTYKLSENPLSVMPDSFKDAVNSPCPMQQIPLYLNPTKPYQDLGYNKFSPFDNNPKETMSPCSPCKSRYPYTSIPCFANPYIKTPHLMPPYLEPLLSVAPLLTASKIPTLDSLDQSYPYLNGDYPREMTPISLLPNTAFSPVNPLLLGPGLVPNGPGLVPCQNLWNNIPYLSYNTLSDQNLRNYPPILNNYLTPSAVLQPNQNQILKPLLSKPVSSSVNDQPCSIRNILEMAPPRFAPSSPVYTSPIQMNFNPPSALERDLQSLSFKYGIPLSKILNSLETEISDAHSKTSSKTLETPYLNFVHDSSLISTPIISKTNVVLDDENRSGYEESLLDSSLIGPHLELDSSLMLESNDSQSHTVLSDTTVLPSSHSSFENEPTKVIKDSSLIGPHLSTLSNSNFVLSDENRNANGVLLSESDISELSLPLDPSLIGPHLEIGSPPIVLDSINSQSDILTSQTEVPITISSQIEPKLNIQNQPTNVLLDSSLTGLHLPSLSAIKPLLSDEIQNINGIIPLETDLTDLTLLDSPSIHTQEDLVNQLDQSNILQHDKTSVTLSAAVPSIKLHKTTEYLSSNITDDEFLLESGSSRLIPLDPSLVGPGPGPELVNSPAEDKTVPAISQSGSLQSTDNEVEELESIILPSSFLPTLLNQPVKADSNHNIITEETNLNEELYEPSLDTNLELPLTDISLIPFNETDFKILEPISELPSLIDDSNIPLLTENSKTLNHKSKSSELIHVVDSETLLDNSLIGPSILKKLDKPEISTSSDSPIHLDSSLLGPSILQEIDSQEMSPILDSVDQLQTSLAATTINQNKKASDILTAIDSSIQVESSLMGPTLHHEINSKETSTAFDSFANSLVPSLHETKESSATTLVLNSSQLDSSLIGPSLHQETLEVSRAFDSKDLLDSSLVGPHLSTEPFSGDEIKMINEELHPESDLADLIPLDSSLVGPHVDFESELELSEISRYQYPESSLTSVNNPDGCETTELPCDLVEGVSPPELITLPSLSTSDLKELLSKFTNAITKSQLSPTELNTCFKLLSSIAKISSGNKNISPSCTELQTLTEYSPITMHAPTHECSPVESFGKLPTCRNPNYFPTPKTLAESLLYAQGVPQMSIAPYSPLVQMKPLIDRNWLPQPLNFQNIHQTLPLISNALIPLTPEDFQPLSDLASHGNLYPALSIPNINTPGDAIGPAPEWITPSYILPLDKYVPLLPKKNSPVHLSNLESTLSNSEYNPIVVDDIMSLLDENSYQLLKDMSILPFSQSSLPPTIPVFEEGEIVSPSLLDTVPIINSDFIKIRPLLPIPITNPLVPSSICNPQIRLYNPQNIPYLIETPNLSPCNLQPYSNIPLHSQFSEIIGPAPKLVTVPPESPKSFLQQLLSEPCVESPIILPSSSLDRMLQLPTASNELNNVPCQLPPEYFTPISPIYTKPLAKVITNQTLPIYASPLTVSYAKPISKSSTSLPLNVPYVDSHLTPLPFSINPCTGRQLTPKYSSPYMPLIDYPYSPTVAYNRPIHSEIPYKQSQTYSSSYLPNHASPIPIGTSAGSPNIISRLPPAMTTPISPVLYEPLSTPYFSPLPKSLSHLGLPAYSGPFAPNSFGALAPTPSGLLTPYLSPYIPTYSYPSLPAPINTQTRPSNLHTPSSSSPSSYNTPLSLNPKIATPGLKSRLLNISPISNAVNPFLNTNQRLPINTKTLPIQSYTTHVPKSSPLSSSQINQNIPCDDALKSTLLTSPLTEEIPSYDVIEESTCTYSYDRDAKFYEEPKLKHPLESLSYTLAPEEITEALPCEELIKQENLTPSATVNNHASEPSLQTKLYQHHRFTPCFPLHNKPLLSFKPHPAPQLLEPPSLIETISQNVFENTPLVPLSRPLKYPVPLPTSILSNALLKPLTTITSAPNFLISSPLLPIPSTDTSLSPYNILPMNKKPLLYSPYYSSPPIDPRELRNIVTPQVTPVFSQVQTNAPYEPVFAPISQPLISPHILDNYIELPSTHYEPKSKTLTSLGSLVKPSSIAHYNQYIQPIISHISPFEMPITPEYITPLTPPQDLKKTKPVFSPQYTSSVSPGQVTLQDSLLLNEAPTHYLSYIPRPAALTSSINNMFKSPSVTLPYTVLPSVNMVEPESTGLNKPQSPSPSPFTPLYSLPSSFSPVPLSSSTVSYSNVSNSRVSPLKPKHALTNHIIPSSLFMSCNTDFQTPTNKLCPLNNIARKSYPLISLVEPLAVPFYTPSRPLDITANPQDILKPKSPLSSVQYTVPLSSSPYFTQLLQPTDSYQIQPLPNVQYTTKPPQKLSPAPVQYASPSLSPIYTSIPLETVPKQIINNHSAPQYSFQYVPVCDTPIIHSSPSDRNSFMNPDFKPIAEVPVYSVPKNIFSSPLKLAPSTSILFSNLKPLDISKEPQNLYSSPITSSFPIYSSPLLKPLVKTLLQKPSQYQPHIIPSNSQYVSQLPIDSFPQLLPSSSPLLKSPLLKPLFTTSQRNVPSLPMHFSNTNTAFPEAFPIEAVPSVTCPNIALSNYLPSDSSNHKYSGPYDSLVSEIPEIVRPINLSSTTPYIFLKSPFNKHFKSPVSSLTRMPLYSNYDILEPSPKLSIRANIINNAKPVEVSATSASESSPLSVDSLDTEMIETTEPYIPPKTLPSLIYKTSRPTPLIPEKAEEAEAAELIDTTDFIPLSQIKSEPLIADYSPNDRKATNPNIPSNIPVPYLLQLSPYSTLLNSEFPPPTCMQLPSKSQTPRFNNKILQPSPIYLSPQEYKDLTQGPSPINYNKIAQRPQTSPKSDHFYANNHIGKGPQVFNVPTYNTLPLSPSTEVKSRFSSVSPEIFKDFTNIPPTYLGFVPTLDPDSVRPNEYIPEIADSPENVPSTNSYPQNYLNPSLKYSSQMNSPLNTIKLDESSEMTPISYSPHNNIDDIKYSGYKTYQIPSFKSPQTPHILGIPTQRYSPSVVTYSSPNPSKLQPNPSSSHFYRPTEISEPLIPQYQTPITMTTPLQTKLGLDTLQESPELDEYNLVEDIPISADNINEDNELKTSLINYINKREDVKNNLFSNNGELTIPIGNIAITRKEPYNTNIIETNNPSIGLKVWKSNVKIAEAELKLKFKDLSVNNFMPIVNNLDKYDMGEIRKIVKNYIDEKYGKHIEINEPYTIDNKYTVLKDFDHNAVDDKYNLLWPTNYV